MPIWPPMTSSTCCRGWWTKSLVVVDRTHATTRYGMSETIRQYAEERLVASGEARPSGLATLAGTRTSLGPPVGA
jgi:hypothetical protein